MKTTTYNDIQSLFKSGEIQTIKFSKTGRVSVKFVKQSHLVTYPKSENVIDQIKKDAEFFNEVKQPVVIKLTEAMQLQDIFKESGITCDSLDNALNGFKPKKSLFERFYDATTNFLSGGKSFAPNELKTFS